MWIHWTVTCGISFIINKGRSHNHVMKKQHFKIQAATFQSVLGSDPEMEKKLGSFCSLVHETKTSLSWEESTGRCALPDGWAGVPAEQAEKKGPKGSSSLFPWQASTEGQNRRGGSPEQLLLPLHPQPCWGNSWEQLESRLAAGEGKEPPGQQTGGTCLTSNLSHIKHWSKYLPVHTDPAMAEWGCSPEKVPLAFKGASFLGWEMHIFHRHAVFLKTLGTICGTWDVCPKDHALALAHLGYLPALDGWEQPQELLLCNLSSQHFVVSPVLSRRVMWRSRPPQVLGTDTRVPPALTDRGGSVKKPSDLKHSLFDRCSFERRLSFYFVTIFQNKN